MTERDLLFLCSWLPEIALQYHDRQPHIVEVGTFLGSTGRGLISLTGGMLSAIDNWSDVLPHLRPNESPQEAWWKTIRTNGVDLSSFVEALHSGESAHIGSAWTKDVDILFIDGSHRYPAVVADLVAFVPHLAPGGYLLIDDWDIEDVRWATQDVVHPHTPRWEVIRVPLGTLAPSLGEEKLWVARRN